jgi:hypothetical protein
LLQWIHIHGSSKFPLVGCSHPIHNSRSLFVDQDAAANTVLLSIPLRLTLNRLTAKEPPLSLQYPTIEKVHTTTTPGSTSSIETMAALFLLHAKHTNGKPQSKWDDYINTLPSRSKLLAFARNQITPPLFWTKSQRKNTKSSGIGTLLSELRSTSKAIHHELFRSKSQTFRKAFGKVRVSDFQWALSMVLSRSFKIPIPWEKNKNLRHVMIPGADLINFSRNASTHLRIHGRNLNDARLDVLASIAMKKGDELTSSYGQLNSPCVHTLIHYGFCDDSSTNREHQVAAIQEDSNTKKIVLVSQSTKIQNLQEKHVMERALKLIQEDLQTIGVDKCEKSIGVVTHNKSGNECEIMKTLRQEKFVLQNVIEDFNNRKEHRKEL